MPRVANNINPIDLLNLKEDVLCRYGTMLHKSVDCDKIAKVVSRETKSYINGITFKRLFGFTKYPYNPSYQTLDILCKYIGFENWIEYLAIKNQKSTISEQEITLYKSIFDFDYINDVKNDEGGIQSISRQIIKKIISAPNSFKIVIDALANNKWAQIFIFEHFPIYDYLIPFYHYAYIQYLKHKKTREAQLFGNSILFLKALWTFDKDEASKRIKEINKTGLSSEIHPFVLGRYFASNLYYTHFFTENDTKQLVEKIIEFEKRIKIENNHFKDFPAFHYIISEALLHCNYYLETINIIDIAFNKYQFKREFAKKGYYRQMLMFKADALFELGDKNQAQLIMKKVNPNNFYFISKKYYTTLYHLIKFKINPNQISKDLSKRFIIEMQNNFLNLKYQAIVGESCF